MVVPTLETMAREAVTLGLEVNWQKTEVRALGCREDMPLTIKVQGQDVMVVEEFVYLGSLIHSTTGSTCDITRAAEVPSLVLLEVTARYLNEVEAVQHGCAIFEFGFEKRFGSVWFSLKNAVRCRY